MMHNVGKNIALAVVAALAAGCTEHAGPLPQEEMLPVDICASQHTMTRADDSYVGTMFTASKRVGVFGYAYDDATWQPSLPPNFFYNQPMTIESSAATSQLSYSPVVYWPVEGRKVAVYGYYPYSEDATNIVPDVASGMGTFAYTTPLQASAQTDFMVSPLLTGLTSDDGTLRLSFYHVLASIEINVDLGTAYKQINKAEVLHVSAKGLFLPQVMTDGISAGTDDWRTTAWPAIFLSEPVDMTVSGELSENSSLDAGSNNIYKLLVIPQQCVSGQTKIRLTLMDNADNLVTKEHDLSDLWRAGTVYRYTFSPAAP